MLVILKFFSVGRVLCFPKFLNIDKLFSYKVSRDIRNEYILSVSKVYILKFLFPRLKRIFFYSLRTHKCITCNKSNRSHKVEAVGTITS